MRDFGSALARGLVRLRWLIVAGWIAAAVYAGVALPSIGSGAGGSLGALVPKNAPALKAEAISKRQFRFPVLSRTVIVVRNPHGLSPKRQGELVLLAERLSRGRVEGFGQIAGALPVLNAFGAAPFSREHSTTVLLYLYFRPGINSFGRSQVARRLLAQEVGQQRGESAGVTGEAPGRVSRTSLINANLGWVELATVALVALALAVHFRALGGALMTLLTIGVAYVLSDRLVEQFGRAIGATTPAEVQPVLVVLVFGIVTDYSIFFLSAFRTRVTRGGEVSDIVEDVTRRTSPIIAVAGITVAVGTASLIVARLEFLRAFGPGLAVAAVIAIIVSLTLIPALLAIGGTRLLWPSHAARAHESPSGRGSRAQGRTRVRTVQFAVRRPLVAAALAILLIGVAATGLLRIALGNELILGLPAEAGAHQAYEHATAGFAAGALAPAILVVTGPHVAQHRAALSRLQTLLTRAPDVAQVLGPAQQPLPERFGVALSRSGSAARYALFLGSDPLGARAISVVRHLNHRLPHLLSQAGLGGYHALVGGDTALSADTVDDTLSDLGRVAPTVFVAIFLVIAVFLRALVAPIYLVLTSGLAVLASLGLTVYVMQMLLGYGQITYYVVFVVAVLLVSLGSDYNVFLVGRIWQEARVRQFRDAVEAGAMHTARPITTAGIVLAVSFALLVIVPVRAFREIAFAMAAGLLIDAFLVRTILVPALLVLVGPVSAWPGRRVSSARVARDTASGVAPAGLTSAGGERHSESAAGTSRESASAGATRR